MLIICAKFHENRTCIFQQSQYERKRKRTNKQTNKQTHARSQHLLAEVITNEVGNNDFYARQHICYSAYIYYGNSVPIPSVCLSVCPSVRHTRALYQNGEYIIEILPFTM